jgi:pimeloyl-ACP methyl ester carboxylesterase
MKISNGKEMLDLVVEGNLIAATTILFVHGFGSDKNETDNYFADVAKELGKQHRIVRFDFAGYGKSEGRQEDVTLLTEVDDLKAVLDFAREKFPRKIFIFAHSMGTFVTSLLCPDGIERTVFTGMPNPDLSAHRMNLQRAIQSRPGGVLNVEGISIYPRTSGETQKIGRGYWEVLTSLKSPVKDIERFALKTDLSIIHSMQDEIIGSDELGSYWRLHTNYRELPGDHNFTRPEDRRLLIETVKRIFEK